MTTFYSRKDLERLCELLTDMSYKQQEPRYEDAKTLWESLGSIEQLDDSVMKFNKTNKKYEFERFLTIITASGSDYEYIMFSNPTHNNYVKIKVSDYEVYKTLGTEKMDSIEKIFAKRKIKEKYTDRLIKFMNDK